MMDNLSQLRMVVYVADKRITDEAPDSIQYFCDELFDYKYDPHIPFSKHKILDALNFYFTIQPSIDPWKKVNDVLKRCEKIGLAILKNELRQLDINPKDLTDADFFTNDVKRKKAFRKISGKVSWQYHYLGHFLISQQHLRDIYEKHEATSDRVNAILLKWYQSTPGETRTWQHLNAVLRFLEILVNTDEFFTGGQKEMMMNWESCEELNQFERPIPIMTGEFETLYSNRYGEGRDIQNILSTDDQYYLNYVACHIFKGVCNLDMRLDHNLDYNELACIEALKIVTKMIGDDWVCLSERLKVKVIVREERTNQENMTKCFEAAQMKIIWRELKYHLKTINRGDIIEEITRETCITNGLESNSNMLKEHYQKILKNWNTPAAFKDRTGRKCMTEDRKKAYVNLMVGEWDKAHSSDREHFLRSFTKCKSEVQMKDIVQTNDQVIVIRGIAGIGKTSFIDSLVLNWSNEEMLTNLDFVFKYTCRELNSAKNINNWQDLIKKKLSICYNGMMDDLNDISDRILLIVDGLDEFKYLNDLTDTSREQYNLAFIFYDLLGSSVLSNKKMILCGRPRSCGTIRQILLTHDSMMPSKKMLKLMEITGFDDNSIETYIDQFFLKTGISSQHLKTALYDMDIIKAMAHIPVYLYIICNVYGSERKLEEFNTTTKLNIAACLVFLRDHMADFKGKNTPLSKLCEEESVMKMIRVIAKFAYKSLMERNIVFEENEFKNEDCLESIESSGIFEKFEGDEEGDVYQFTHLVLQEFLSAVHIFSLKLNVLEWKGLKDCAPIVAGLCGISQEWYQGPKYLKTFVDALCEATPSRYIKTLEYFSLETSLFLLIYYEYQGGNILTEYSPKQYYKIEYHHTLNHLSYFLRSCNTKLEKLIVEIDMNDGHLHSGDNSALLSLLHLFPLLELRILFTFITVDSVRLLSQEMKKQEQKNSSGFDRNRKVLNLTLMGCNLQYNHIKELCICIPFLKSLHFIQRMTELWMQCISDSISGAVEQKFNILEELALVDCHLGDIHIRQLQKCMPFLKILNLGSNNLSEQSMKYISDTIIKTSERECNMLEELHFYLCGLRDNHIKILCKCVPLLRKLNISGNYNMTEQSMICISNAIIEASEQKCNVLEELNLFMCDLSDSHIEILCECVPLLKKLILSGNRKMTGQSMKYISDNIIEASEQKCNMLEELNLDHCSLNDSDIETLCQCVPFLRKLDLSNNKDITGQLGMYLSDVLIKACERNDNTLEELYLRKCNMNDEDIILLKQCIPFVKNIFVGGNTVLEK